MNELTIKGRGDKLPAYGIIVSYKVNQYIFFCQFTMKDLVSKGKHYFKTGPLGINIMHDEYAWRRRAR